MAQGSVLFYNSMDQITQDNANFFWDDTNNRLGIGTASPVHRLHVLAPYDSGGNVGITFESTDAGNVGPVLDFYHNSASPAAALRNVELAVRDFGGVTIEINRCKTADPTWDYANVPYNNHTAWHFLRVTHTGGTASLCIDGNKVTSFQPTGSFNSPRTPHIGANVTWLPQDAYLDGGIDDLRVLSTALPCD